MNGTVVIVAVVILVLALAALVVSAVKRRDLGMAIGDLSRETVKRDRAAAPSAPAAAATGKDVERAAVLARTGTFVDARDPFRLWVRAEALRAAERFAEARDTATQAIDRDPGFGAALITRAASWVGLGFPQEANADLVFLETAWATLPGYDVLIERLARVVR